MRRETEMWWRQAEDDLKNAHKNLDMGGYYLVVFLCQQAVEKGLKAYFFKIRNTGPGTTHSLVYLATETNLPQKFFKFLRKLMPQFVTTRYPDAAYGVPSELYDKSIASEYLQETDEVMQWLRSKIKE